MTDRSAVYKAIDGEREYQNIRWTRQSPNRTIDEWAMYLQVYSSEMCSIAAHTGDSERAVEKLDYLRKIAAMAVAAMEQHGVTERGAV